MKRLIFVTLTASMLSVSGVSLAQTPVQPAPDASAPAPEAAPPAKRAARPKVPPIPGEALRRSTCRQKVDQSLKGPELIDQLQICMAEARLNCLRRAVEDKLRGKQRQAFMSTCGS
jgi:hypothetical protein